MKAARAGHWGMLLLAALSGRALAEAVDVSVPPTHESFSAYGERIFRWQNALLDQLLEAENGEPPPSAIESLQLAKAEARIIRSCQALNEAASLSASGRRPDVRLRLKVAASLRSCDSSARAVSKFLLAREQSQLKVFP